MQPLPAPPADGRLARRLIFWTAGTVVAVILCVGIYLVYKQDYAPPAQPVAPPPSEVPQASPSTNDPGSKPAQRLGTNRLLSTPAAQASIPTATAFQATPLPPQQQTFSPPPSQQETKPQPEAKTSAQKGTPPPLGTPSTKKEPKPPSKYLFAPTDNVAKSPFSPSAPTPPDSTPGTTNTKSALIKDANVELPADPDVVWYRSQGITGVLVTDINSDTPGQIIMRVTRELQAKSLSGYVLIPQHALIVALPAATSDGIDRLTISLQQIELPDGGIIPLTSKVSDQYGAGGLTGDVNRHIPQKILGVLATAILSVGVRVPSGNTEGYVPTLGQQTAAQAGQGLSAAGQAIVQKQFSRPDTIFIPADTPLTIYPDANISFAKPAKVVQ